MEELKGLYEKTIYKDEKTGYTGFFFAANDSKIFCVGKIQHISINTPLKLSGEYQTDANNRKKFVIDDYNFYQNIDSEIQLLMSYQIKHFKFENAETFANFFNGDLLNKIEMTPSARIFRDECPKELQQFAKEIYSKTKRLLDEKKLFKEIIQAGGTYSNVSQLLKKNGNNAYENLKSNPYLVGHTCGFSFKTCDNLAYKLNFSKYALERATGLLYYSLDMVMEQGHSFATTCDLNLAVQLLQRGSLFEEIPFLYILSRAVLESNISIVEEFEEPHIYFNYVLDQERIIVENFNRIMQSSNDLPFEMKYVDMLETREKVSLSSSQKNCFHLLKSEGLKIITGGPGTGKTTTVNLIIKYCETYYPNMPICLCAPTGCAAQNMTEKTGRLAETVHRTLGCQPFSERKMRITKKLVEKIYIIDEVSMLDLELASMLLSSIPNGSLVIFVGDVNQLPSVCTGNVLDDFIKSKRVEVYELTEIFRQKGDSAIIENAYKINNGNTDLDLEKSDFTIFTVNDEDAAVDLCLSYVESDPANYQILCPIKKYSSGTWQINTYVQDLRINEPFKQYGNLRFFKGDKVIATENNYRKGYFNGEPGSVLAIDEDGIEISFSSGKNIFVENMNLSDIIPAYAITIHKSQGNEYPEVVILLTQKSICMMNRNLLYTAVTRAKCAVTIIEEEGLLSKALNAPKFTRNSDLSTRLNLCRN